MAHRLEAEPLPGIGEVQPGTDLAASIAAAADEAVATIGSGDVFVIAQKLVSKSEGRLRALADVSPSRQALDLGDSLDKDPRLIQVILDESTQLLRAQRGVLIARARGGFVCANAGVDQSNVATPDTVCLLPEDPDGSARALRAAFAKLTGHRPAVLISDSFGRAWRIGQSEVAIGCAGLAPVHDRRGQSDAQGRELLATIDAIADEAAAAAGLVREKDGGDGVVVVRGLERFVSGDDGPGAATIVRPIDEDLFA